MTPARILLALLALLAALALAACSSPGSDSAGTVLLPAKDPLDLAKPAPGDEGAASSQKCQHDWQQVDWHLYQEVQDGLPVSKLCVVTRCPKCGEVRHECQKRRR